MASSRSVVQWHKSLFLALVFLLQIFSQVSAFPLNISRIDNKPAQLPHQLHRRVHLVKEDKCQSYLGFIDRAFVDLQPLICKTALSRLKRLETLLPRLNEEVVIPGLDRSTLYPTEAFFATIYHGTGHADNAIGLNTVKLLITRTEKLLQALPTGWSLDIRCDDTFLKQKNGRRPPAGSEEDLRVYDDYRPIVFGGTREILMPFHQKCHVNKEVYLRFVSQVEYSQFDLLIFCPRVFRSMEFENDPRGVRGWLATGEDPGSSHIETLFYKYLSFPVLEGIAGAKRILPEELITEPALKRGANYWTAIEFTINNPLDVVLRSSTLYAERWDWSLGFNTAMFQDFAGIRTGSNGGSQRGGDGGNQSGGDGDSQSDGDGDSEMPDWENPGDQDGDGTRAGICARSGSEFILYLTVPTFDRLFIRPALTDRNAALLLCILATGRYGSFWSFEPSEPSQIPPAVKRRLTLKGLDCKNIASTPDFLKLCSRASITRQNFNLASDVCPEVLTCSASTPGLDVCNSQCRGWHKRAPARQKLDNYFNKLQTKSSATASSPVKVAHHAEQRPEIQFENPRSVPKQTLPGVTINLRQTIEDIIPERI
ncbi:hypothetical protein FQN57_002696 [Myotisia sp. PD_48]|nr:hypothetical protein FQN57_002696 [Myotisia sp. PD_48]